MKPEPLPSKLAVEPTAKAALRIADALAAKLPDLRPEQFWTIAYSLLVASMQTVDAIYYLVAESQPKAFPAQTAPLLRTLLEALGNYLALAESPDERPGLFARDAFLTASEWHQQWLERHGTDPEWADRLRLYAEGLQAEARTIGLSTSVVEDPAEHLQRWPTPGRLLGRHGAVRLTGERRAVFAEIYDSWYAHLSYYAH